MAYECPETEMGTYNVIVGSQQLQRGIATARSTVASIIENSIKSGLNICAVRRAPIKTVITTIREPRRSGVSLLYLSCLPCLQQVVITQ